MPPSSRAPRDPMSMYRASGGRVTLTSGGRAAIELAWNALGIKPGDEILAPAYTGGCEVDSCNIHGFRAVFYRVDETCRADLDDAMRRVTPRTRAVYLIHFYGVPQDSRAWADACRARGLYLIEDCAHGIFGRDGAEPMGLQGDLAIFSFNKTLGFPDGGALLINNPKLPNPPPLPDRSLFQVRRMFARQLFLAHTPDWILAHALRYFHRRRPNPLRKWINTYQAYRGELQPTKISQRLLSGLEADSLIWRRREIYSTWLDACPRNDAVRPLLGRLPEGVNPLFFALWVSDREIFRRRLIAEGAAVYRWWIIPHPDLNCEAFPEAARLHNHVLAIPINPALTQPAVEHLATVLKKIDLPAGALERPALASAS